MARKFVLPCLEEELSMEVKGRDLSAGLPKTLTIRSEEIREALQEPLSSILESVRITLERCPPELAADLVDRGIVLAGGGSLLRGAGTTLLIAFVGTLIGCVIGFLCGVVKTIPVAKKDSIAKKIVLKIVNFLIDVYVPTFSYI